MAGGPYRIGLFIARAFGEFFLQSNNSNSVGRSLCFRFGRDEWQKCIAIRRVSVSTNNKHRVSMVVFALTD